MSGRILHFGVGNFCRAHLADYTHDAGNWSVTGVSLRSPAVRDGLRAQGFDYSLCVQGQGVKRITVFDRILVAPEHPAAVMDAICAADVHIISLTVTEKGYHLTADNRLDLDDPLIIADLQGEGPQTVIGFLAHGLAKRDRPVTVLSCDNRNANGDVLRQAVAAYADHAGIDLDWSILSFPNAMVDRITPATTDAVRTSSGDPMAVPTEPFREWVVEDQFAGARPDWPEVQFVADVAPHEMRKLRMLNGAHSWLAYAGVLAGYDYVHQAIADIELRASAQALMAEAAATLPAEVRHQAEGYAQALISRFENPELAHRLRQIAMDGSQKLPYRFVDSLRLRLDAGLPAPTLVDGVRAWIAFCKAEHAAGRSIQDPKAGQIATAIESGYADAMLLDLIGAADLKSIVVA